jgi:endonuclease/exonuclease/phosphatase family metal-dependent hydrolase
MARSLRVLTLNCWNVSEPFAARMAVTRAGIAALQPDLIGLQEIVVRRDGLDQGAVILGGLGYHCVFAPSFRWDERSQVLAAEAEGDAFGNLIASRWPIRAHDRLALPGSESGERRCALAALVEAPFGVVPFLSTHLNWRFHHGSIRERQVTVLADFARKWARGAAFPPIIGGDLNAEPDATEIRFLCGLASIDGRSTYFQDAWRVAGSGPGYTWDNRNRFAAYMFEPDRRIDYILVGIADASGRGWIEHAQVVFDEPADGVFASDHFGVVADVRV